MPTTEQTSLPLSYAEKIKVASVQILWAEGYAGQVLGDAPQTFRSLHKANLLLRRMAAAIPEDMQGCDKTDFIVTWADGQDYKGRYDLKRKDKAWANIGRHILEGLQFITGQYRPPHLTESAYREIIDASPLAERQEIEGWLNRYSLI